MLASQWVLLQADITRLVRLGSRNDKKLLGFREKPKAAKILTSLVVGGQIPDSWAPIKVREFRKELSLVEKDASRARLLKLRKEKRNKSTFMILLYL